MTNNENPFDLGLTEADMDAIMASETTEPKPASKRYAVPLDEVHEEIEDEENILDELDLGSFPLVPAGGHNDSSYFCEQFLTSIREVYTEKGVGTFECILRFPHNKVTDEVVESFLRSVSARISRMRSMNRKVAPFRVVHAHYEILPDKRHVALRTIRMTEERYQIWYRENRKKIAEKKSIDRKLANLL